MGSTLAKSTRKWMQKSIQSHPRRRPGTPKIEPKLITGPLGTPRGTQERRQGVAAASRERLGASPARPGNARRLPKGAPGRQKERQAVPGSTPRRPKSTPSRVLERKHRVFSARLTREASSERFVVDLCRFSAFSQSLRTL